MIKSLRIQNLLSFGTDGIDQTLDRLNVFIGPNGSGKSNFLEAISLLHAAPTNLSAPVKEVGGVREWLWKGTPSATASLEAVVDYPQGRMALRHALKFSEHGQRFELTDERIENERPFSGRPDVYFYYRFSNGHPVLNEQRVRDDVQGGSDTSYDRRWRARNLKRENISPEQSVLSQVKDPERYPELTFLSTAYSRIEIFRDWSFGRYTVPRQEQKADLRNDFLSATGDNLALVLNKMQPRVEGQLADALSALYEGITGIHVQVEAGRVQLFLRERGYMIPATRLSDGTLRYLCLLAILCHPSPPPLICIEEPELGLHPDVMPEIARLLVDAAERTQLIVTTHSEALVDALNDYPEYVVVCEKEEGGTVMRRLDKESLSAWLKKYTLGRLWRMGEIGGNRW